MAFEDEQKIFDEYVKKMGLKQSEQRRDILLAFLKTEKHLTADELHGIVKRKNPSTGAATVYRTLKLLRECGLCREFRLNDGTTRYEHLSRSFRHMCCRSAGVSLPLTRNWPGMCMCGRHEAETVRSKEHNFMLVTMP